MSRVLIATEKPFAAPAVAGIKSILSEAGFEVVLLEKYSAKSELLAAVADVDAIIIRSDIIDQEVFDAAPQLKIVVRAGAGYDNVDLEAATAHGVCVMNTPGQNANAVAELVFALLLFTVRNRFNGASGTELKDKKLGLLAYGNTGRNVARIAKGDFIRLKEVSLGYDLPAQWFQKAMVKNVSLKLQATNLFLLYADKRLNGQDPEFYNVGGVASPMPKQFTLTIKLGL